MRNIILVAIFYLLSRAFTSSPAPVQTEHSYVHISLKEPSDSRPSTLIFDNSEPLTEKHLELPIQQINRVTPGMEPAKEPVASKPVAYGHYETQRYGFRGRYSRQVWVPKQTYQYNYSSGGCSSGSCSRGGIF